MIEELSGYQLIQLAKLHHQAAGPAFAKIGLHIGQEQVLFHLEQADGLTQSELITRLCVEPPTVTKALQRMERGGLVRRARDAGNNRVWRVYLTDHGRSLLEPARRIWRDLDQRMLAGLSAEEQGHLHSLLGRAVGNLSGA